MAFGIGDLITINEERYFLDTIREDGALVFRPVQDKKLDWNWSDLVGKKIKDTTGREHKVVKVNDDNPNEIWLTLDGGGYSNTYSRFTDKEDFNKRFVIAKIIRGKEMKKETYNIPKLDKKAVSVRKGLEQIVDFGKHLKVHFDEKFRTAKIEISDEIVKKAVANLKAFDTNIKLSDSSECNNTANGSIAHNGYNITYTWADVEDAWKNMGKKASVKAPEGRIEIVNDKFEVVACVAGNYEDFEIVCDKLTPNEEVMRRLGFGKKDGKYIKVASGDLVIKDHDDIAKDCETFDDALDMLGYIGNGYDFFNNADDLYVASNKEFSLGLTSAPTIVEGGYYDDDGKYVVPEDAKIYVFDGYEVLDELKILQEKGEVTFVNVENSVDKISDEFDNGDNIVANGSKKIAYKDVFGMVAIVEVFVTASSAEERNKLYDFFKKIYKPNNVRTFDDSGDKYVIISIDTIDEDQAVRQIEIDLEKGRFNVEASKIKVLKKTATEQKFKAELIQQKWSDGSYITVDGEEYSVNKFSNGQYFLLPKGIQLDEKMVSDEALWLGEVEEDNQYGKKMKFFEIIASKKQLDKKTAEIVQQTTNVFFDNAQEMIEYNKAMNKDNPSAEPAQSGAPTNTEVEDTNTEPTTELDNTQPQENKTELPESDIEITPSSKKEVGTQKEADETDKKDPQESADKYDLKGLIADLKTFPIFDRMTETEALNTLNEQYAVAINIENGNSAMVKSNLLKNPFFYTDELKKVKEQEAQNAPVETQAQNEDTVIKQKTIANSLVYKFKGTQKTAELFERALKENGIRTHGFAKKADVVLSGAVEYTAHLDVEDLCKLVLDETMVTSSKNMEEIMSKVENGIKDIVSDIKAVSIEFNDADVNDIQIDSTKGSVSVEGNEETIKECIGDFIYAKREALGIADKAKVEMDGDELAGAYFANKKTSNKTKNIEKEADGNKRFRISDLKDVGFFNDESMSFAKEKFGIDHGRVEFNQVGYYQKANTNWVYKIGYAKSPKDGKEYAVVMTFGQVDYAIPGSLYSGNVYSDKQSDKFIGEDLGAEPAMSDDPDIKKEQPFVDDNGMNFSKYQSNDKKDLWENKHSKKEMEEVIFKDLVFMILESSFTPKEAVNQIMKDYGVPFNWVYDFYWNWNNSGRPTDFKQVVNKKAYRETYIQPKVYDVSIDAKDEEEANKIAETLVNNGEPFSEISTEGHFVDFAIHSDSEQSAETKIKETLRGSRIEKDACKIKSITKKATDAEDYTDLQKKIFEFLESSSSAQTADWIAHKLNVNKKEVTEALKDMASEGHVKGKVYNRLGKNTVIWGLYSAFDGDKKAYKSLEVDDYADYMVTIITANKEESEKIVQILEGLTTIEEYGDYFVNAIWYSSSKANAIKSVKEALETNGFKKDASKIKAIEKTAKTDPAYKSMEQNLKKEKVKGKCPNCGKNTLIKKKDGIRTLREWVECTNCTLAFETDKPKKDDGYLVENGIWEDTNKERAMMRSAGVKELSIGDKIVTLKEYKSRNGVVTDIERVQDVYKTRENFEEYKNMYGLNLSWDNNSIVDYEVKFEDEDGISYKTFKYNEIRKVSFITKERLLELSKNASYTIDDQVVVSPQGKADYKYQGQVGKVVSIGQDNYDVKVGNEVLQLSKNDIYPVPKEANITEDKEAVKKKSKEQIPYKEKTSKKDKTNISKKASSEVEKEIKSRIFGGADAYTHKDVWDKTINRVIEDWVIRADERYEGKWTEESDTGAKYPSDKNAYEDFVEDYLTAHIDDIVEEIQISGEEKIENKNDSNKTSDLSDIQASSEEDLINEAKKYKTADEFIDAQADKLGAEYEDILKQLKSLPKKKRISLSELGIQTKLNNDLGRKGAELTQLYQNKSNLVHIWEKANAQTNSNKTANKNKEEKLKKLHDELDKYIETQEHKNPNFDLEKDSRVMQLKRQIDDLENNKESYIEWEQICQNDRKDFKSRVPRNRDWSTPNEEGIVPSEMQS